MSVKTSQNPSNTISQSGVTYTIPNINYNTVTVSSYGGGGSGGYTSPWGSIIGGTNSPSNTTISSTILSIKAENNGDAIIETHHHKINLDEFYKLTTEMLCIIQDDKNLHKEYPTLKDAYDNYIDKRKDGIKININDDVRDAYNTYQTLKAVITGESNVK